MSEAVPTERDITWMYRSRPRKTIRRANMRAPKIKEMRIQVVDLGNDMFAARYTPLDIEIKLEGKNGLYALNAVRAAIIKFINNASSNNLKLRAE